MTRAPAPAMRDTVTVFLLAILACAPVVAPPTPLAAAIYLGVSLSFTGFVALLLVVAFDYRRVRLTPLPVLVTVGLAAAFALAARLALTGTVTGFLRGLLTAGAGGLGLGVGLWVAYDGPLDRLRGD
ncbi:hypothetical protein [Salinirussus salinus]|uniref:hypothetical protein n=1 Tax=Salinirussus salinus TaxID=1198300 RepID=UPI001356892A|nr:hypothetical protein [Salinirussus salinus]